jgi:hypothetical protein
MHIESKRIKIDDLHLDKDNPRLPKSMSNKTEEEIINYFLSEASLLELMLAIGINNFFEGEQLLVAKEDGKYIVIEGNRRLSAVKLLHNPDLAKILKGKVQQVLAESKFFPLEIPCLVFPSRDDILKYLGYRHITGIKPWKLLEKARYINKLKADYFNQLNIQSASREIAKMIGSRMDYVRRILVGFEIYTIIDNNDFYKIRGLNDIEFHFNYIADSLSKVHISEFLGVSMDDENPAKNPNFENIKEWTNWLFNKDLPNKIIGDSEHLNKLNNILKFEQALNAFRQGVPIDKALEFTDDYNERIENSIKQAISNLEDADSISHKVTFFYSNVLDDLKDINKLLQKIKLAKDNFESQTFENGI